jgi:hypothetical protein
MKMLSLIAAVLGIALLSAAASSQVGRQDDSAQRIKELQKERLATLKEMVDTIKTMRRGGVISVDEVYDATQLLLNAELDAAEGDADRIKLLEEYVGTAKGLEAMVDAQRQAAVVNYASVLKTKSRRLEAEIALEQAKAKLKK